MYRAIFFGGFLAAFCSSFVRAENMPVPKIYIHTDNINTFSDLEKNASRNSLSSASNIYALDIEGYDIRFEYMTLRRSMHFIDEGLNVCIANRIKTEERAEKYIFSLPVNLFLSRRLYQNVNYPPLYDSNHELMSSVYLPELFKRKPDSRLLMTGQISYGEAIDQQLTQVPPVNKLTREGSEPELGIFNMFVRDRAEFALFYPQQLKRYNTIHETRSYAINSTKPYVLGRIMCVSNKDTKAFIASVNQNITSLVKSGKLADVHLSFMLDSDKAIFNAYFEQTYSIVK